MYQGTTRASIYTTSIKVTRMILTLKQLQKTAALAYLDNQDAETLLDEALVILNQIQCIRQIDVSGIEPLVHPIEMYQFLREDVVLDTRCAEQLAEAAPTFIENHYVVPKQVKD
jgi:aspartyl-tRNA(Asn)/glutamyl-tRNA(Gln) amidotransferase subunit C